VAQPAEWTDLRSTFPVGPGTVESSGVKVSYTTPDDLITLRLADQEMGRREGGHPMRTRLRPVATTVVIVLTLALGISAKAQGAAAPPEASWTRVASFATGSGPGEVGLRFPGGSTGQGPEALSVAPDGTVFMLDSVNRRIYSITQGGHVTSVNVDSALYPRELLATEHALYVLDSTNRVLELDRSGVVVRESALPRGLPSTEVIRLAENAGRVLVWIGGYKEFDLQNLPAEIDLESYTDAKNRSRRGVTAPDGRRWIGEAGGIFSTTDGASSFKIATRGAFGAARLMGFDAMGRPYLTAEDLDPKSKVVKVEWSLRRFESDGSARVARLPLEELAMAPHRPADVAADGTVYVMLPRPAATTIYRVTLGTSYRSTNAPQGAFAPTTSGGSKMPSVAANMSVSLNRKQVAARAAEMADVQWTWHTSYNYYPNSTTGRYDVNPNVTPPAQFVTSWSPVTYQTDGTSMWGIPYSYGGNDANFSSSPTTSTSDWNIASGPLQWSGFSGALSKWRNLSQNGPWVGNTEATPRSGTAGIDCSGFVYAAAGRVGDSSTQGGSVDQHSGSKCWCCGQRSATDELLRSR
jgi:hypothetical protein